LSLTALLLVAIRGLGQWWTIAVGSSDYLPCSRFLPCSTRFWTFRPRFPGGNVTFNWKW